MFPTNRYVLQYLQEYVQKFSVKHNPELFNRQQLQRAAFHMRYFPERDRMSHIPRVILQSKASPDPVKWVLPPEISYAQ